MHFLKTEIAVRPMLSFLFLFLMHKYAQYYKQTNMQDFLLPSPSIKLRSNCSFLFLLQLIVFMQSKDSTFCSSLSISARVHFNTRDFQILDLSTTNWKTQYRINRPSSAQKSRTGVWYDQCNTSRKVFKEKKKIALLKISEFKSK